MSQFLLSVWGPVDELYGNADEKTRQKAYAAVDKFNAKLIKAGILIFAGGLDAPRSATVYDGTDPDIPRVDGPFLRSSDCLGGFWVVEAADRKAARALASQAAKACAGRVEVRAFQG